MYMLCAEVKVTSIIPFVMTTGLHQLFVIAAVFQDTEEWTSDIALIPFAFMFGCMNSLLS